MVKSLKKFLDKIKFDSIIHLKAFQRKGEGIRIFSGNPYERESYEYRRNEVSNYCNKIKLKFKV